MGDSQIEEIKNKLNILDVVGNYVKLTKTGVNYRGICPFHAEKGPSFFVTPSRQMFKCFGCGKGGDVFEFIKEIEGVEFGDALRILAQKAGVQLKRENIQLKTERQRLYEICNLSCSFFEKQLESSEWGKKAKDYLLKRGITQESIKKWRLGYSPETWQGLSDFLVSRAYNRDEIVKAGLAVKSEKGHDSYDRFRGRIIFPIFDLNGQPIGFGARIFKDADSKETAKYLNSPQTLLYDKSNVLYGINFAKVGIRKGNQCVLTEGYTDAIMCHQAGFENTVAVSGTALTSRHLNLLKRYTENLLLAFDMDMAGDNATKRGIDLAESSGFNLKVVHRYDNAKDPAEIILENPENWKSSMEKARTIMDYYFDSAFLKFSDESGKILAENKKAIGRIILPAIKRLQNRIEQSHWVTKLAEKLGVKEEAVLEELKSTKLENAHAESPVVSFSVDPQSLMRGPVGRQKLLEEKIISLALNNKECLNLIEEGQYCFFCDNTKNLIEILKKGEQEQHGEYKDLLNTLSMQAEVSGQEDVEGEAQKEVKLCLLELKDIKLRNELEVLSLKIKNEPDLIKVEELKSEFDKKAKKLHEKIKTA